MSEHIEQVRFVSWWRKNYPEHKIYAIPNGGYRGDKKQSMIVGAKLKAEGVLRGVHDLHIPSLKFWVEMKEDFTDKPTKEQLEWGSYLDSIGHFWCIGYGFEDAKEKAIKFLLTIPKS